MDLLTLSALVLIGAVLFLCAVRTAAVRVWRACVDWFAERRLRKLRRTLNRRGVAMDIVDCKLIDAQKLRGRCGHGQALRALDPAGECRLFCLGCKQRLYSSSTFSPPYTLKDYLADLPPLLPKGSAYRGQLPPKPVIHLFVDDEKDDT